MFNKFQQSVYSLLKQEPFYAHFIMNSRVIFNHPNVPTAGATIINGTTTLIFNESFLENMSVQEIQSIIKHEILHLLLSHVGAAKEEGMDPLLSNLAQDCVINQYITDLPKGCVTLSEVSKMVGKPLEPFQTTKYYYDAMLKKAKQIAASGMSTLDEHDLDMPGQDKGELAKGALNRTVKNAAKQSAGDIPGNLSNVLDALGKPEIRWESLLRNFVFSNVSNQTKYTTKRAHRRFDMPSPGKKKKRQMNIGVCIDVSGSVSDEQCSAFFTEIQSIAKQVTKVYLVQADTEIQHVEEIKNKKFKKERKGYGGTAYQPAINKCKELGCDVIVYFGDGDSADTPVDPKVPFLWVMCGGGSSPASFGKTIKLGV